MTAADLTGRTVVVTGGNRGLGLALATGVGRAGAAVCIWARSAERSASAVTSLASLGINAHAIRCDVSSEADVESAMAQTLARTGGVDAVFANAGVAGDQTPFIDTTFDAWRALLAVDLDGAFLTFRAVARHMVERGEGGALVGVSSIVSRFGAVQKAAYGAAKPAMEGLVRALAVELAPHGIRCNALSPGWTATDMLAPGGSFGGTDHERFKSATVKRTPARRWGEPGDFEAIAAYLADPTLVFHTGDVVTVDGGYSIG